MPVIVSVSTTGLSKAKGKAVRWVFNSHGSYTDTPLRNLSLIAPTPPDTQVLLGPGSWYIPFYSFLEMESTQIVPTTTKLKGSVLWFENCYSQ